MRITQVSEVAKLLVPEEQDDSHAQKQIELVARRGALLRGHFRLHSGDHAEYFLRFSQLGADRAVSREVATAIAATLPFSSEGTKVFCSEAAGLYLGSALEKVLGNPLAICAIDLTRRPTRQFRLGSILAGERVIVVNDVVTAGETVQRLCETVTSFGAEVAGIVAFAAIRPLDFKRFLRERHLEAKWALSANWDTFKPINCPLCRSGAPSVPATELV
jgi:orotate phosphoribosyltransferase